MFSIYFYLKKKRNVSHNYCTELIHFTKQWRLTNEEKKKKKKVLYYFFSHWLMDWSCILFIFLLYFHCMGFFVGDSDLYFNHIQNGCIEVEYGKKKIFASNWFEFNYINCNGFDRIVGMSINLFFKNLIWFYFEQYLRWTIKIVNLN